MSEEKQTLDASIKLKLDILQKYAWFANTFDLSTLKFIGKGSFGVVFSVYHVNFKRTIALKVIEVEKNDLNQAIDELVKMKTLKHPNILEILEHRLIMHHKRLFLLLIMEQGLVSLNSYLAEKPMGMSESELCETMNALSSAVSYAHQNKIVHCDLKPGNIILFEILGNSGFCPKISDWGSAYEYKEFNNDSATKIKTGMNFTPAFLAPELHIFEEENETNTKGNFYLGDVYALGITLLYCAGIKLKEIKGISGEQDKECYEMKIKKMFKHLRDKDISEETIDKIKRMIMFKSKKRELPLLNGNKIEVK